MAEDTVGLTDIAAGLPGLIKDAPIILRGALTGFIAHRSIKASIGKVFQDRAARHGDQVFIRFGDESWTYRQANETVNRYAAVLAERGVRRGDVVGIMLKNSPRMVLLRLAALELGAIAGMLNYHQRDKALARSIGLLNAKVLIGSDDLLAPANESGAHAGDAITVDDLDRLAADAPTDNPVA